jgi:two-component system sensor histidine kinase DesK
MRSGTFDPEAEAVLAWCLREAVTNVIRHSHARHCRIRLVESTGELSLDVTDDGRGFSGPAEVSATGSGLRGISERLSAANGHLALGRGDDGRGFRLTASIPAATTGTSHNCLP